MTIKNGQTLKAPTTGELVQALYNDTRGPAARMVAFKAGVRCTLDALGVKYEHLSMVDRITKVMV